MKRKIVTLATIPLLVSSLYGGFDFGGSEGSCEGGNGTFKQQIPHKDVIEVDGTIPTGINGLYISLKSDNDVDVQLFDKDTGKALVGWDIGALIGDGAEYATTSYKGMTIEYSGYNGDGTGLGHEYIKITGQTTSNLTMKAYGYKSGYAKIDYSWKAKTGCSGGSNPNASGNGTFKQQIPYQDVIEVDGTIPPGIKNLSISLKSDNDVDVQLFDKDTGKALVGWAIGALIGDESDYATTPYKGMTIEYSGYNGDGTGLGHEYIKLTGTTTSNLIMKAYGYKAGFAQIDYKWGDEEEDILDNFISSYFPYSHIANTPISKDGKRLDVIALKQKDYSYTINGTDYNVAGCLPTTYAMAIDYAIRANGYQPTNPKYAIKNLLKEIDSLGPEILSTDGNQTTVDSANNAFIEKINYKGFIDPFMSCDAPTNATFSIEKEKGIVLWTYDKFISKVKSRINNNRPVLIGVIVAQENNDNNYTIEGGHEMLITGYDNNKIYANDTWNTTYGTWNRVDNLNGLTFYKKGEKGENITSKINSSTKLNQNIVFKRGNLLIILKTSDVSFVSPKKIEFEFTSNMCLT